MSLRWAALLLVCLVLISADRTRVKSSEVSFVKMISFEVAAHDAATVFVGIEDDGAMPRAACRFSYRTEEILPAVDLAGAKNTDVQERRRRVMRLVVGEDEHTGEPLSPPPCFTTRLGAFDYTLCIGGELTQQVGDEKWVLGAYRGAASTCGGAFCLTHRYEGGTPCKPALPQQDRKAEVTFACGATARIASLEEVSTCVYNVVVEHPSVCLAPDKHEFDIYSLEPLEPLPTWDEQGWIAEISSTLDGRFVCHAFDTGVGTSRRMRFAHANLLMLTSGEYALSDCRIDAKPGLGDEWYSDLEEVSTGKNGTAFAYGRVSDATVSFISVECTVEV